MKIRDKLKLEYPEFVSDKFMGGCKGCPLSYGYVKSYYKGCCGFNSSGNFCKELWDREMPESDTTTIEVETVNHPDHYQGPNECIDVMEAMFGKLAVIDFCRCNAYKYRFRADKKNGKEDIAKAEWYETKLIELMKEEPYYD